jgi:hypothetical protein
MYIIKSIGDNSVEIAEIISIVCLFYINPYLLIVYVVGIFINARVNETLKKKIGKTMPSGHFQKMTYSIAFVGFSLFYKNKLRFYWKYLAGAYAFIFISCFYNCLVYKYHTFPEIVVGTGIGVIAGYVSFFISQFFIK